MLLFRSFVVGLLGACFVMLATHSGIRVVVPIIYRPGPPVATLVDVAAGVSPTQVASLVHLERGEHVVAVDDRNVTGDLAAGSVLAQIDARPGFVDLEVAGGHSGERRVVLLLH